MSIHPSAIIDKNAKINKDVEIGPYAVIGKDVEIESGCRIFSHAVIGSESQDLKYKGERSFVKIGARTTIREFVTINSGTGEESSTDIGEDCLLMAYSHVAHNCKVGNKVVMANCGTLAGYVEVEDNAIIGGLSAVHQFCKIGQMSLIGGCSKVVQDLPPFMLADGHPAKVYDINSIGLKRNGVTQEVRNNIKTAFRYLYKTGLSAPHAIDRIRTELENLPQITHLINFIETSKRGIC